MKTIARLFTHVLTLLVLLFLGTALADGLACSRDEASPRVTKAASPDTIPWRHDYAAALEEGKKTGKPILIDFSATWCPPCQQMKQNSWPDPQVARLASDSYVPVALDVDEASARAPAERYQISSIPAVFIVKPDGEVVKNQVGLMSADALVDFLSTK